MVNFYNRVFVVKFIWEFKFWACGSKSCWDFDFSRFELLRCRSDLLSNNNGNGGFNRCIYRHLLLLNWTSLFFSNR